MGGLGAELAALCRGRGVMDPDLKARVGPALLSRSGIDPAAGPVEFRYQLVAFLDQAAADLADDLGLAFRAGLALRRNLQARFLTQRLERAAGELGRHPDTVREYLGTAITAVAAALGDYEPAPVTRPPGEPLVRPPGEPPLDPVYPVDGWHLTRLRTFLDLAGTRPVAEEERTVVADRDELASVTVATAIRHDRTASPAAPAAPCRAELAVVYGGSLVRSCWPSPTYLRYEVRLPHPLRRGESHQFGVRLAIPRGQPFDRQYLFTPLLRCDEFELQIRFAARGRKTQVWRVGGLPPGLAADFTDPAALISPDDADEVRLRFTGLRIGLSHGARWVDLHDSRQARALPGPWFTRAGSALRCDQLSGSIARSLLSCAFSVPLPHQRHRGGPPRSG